MPVLALEAPLAQEAETVQAPPARGARPCGGSAQTPSGLGPRVSGLLAPAPVITSILAAFTQAQAGPEATLRLLRGMLTGFVSFALFCWTVAVALPHAAVGVAFGVAVVVAVLTQVAIAGGESIGARPYSR